MNWLDFSALLLVVIGALNWGLVGFFNYDLVSALFGVGSAVTRVIFALVGLAGLYTIVTLVKAAREASHHTPSTMRAR